MCDRWLGAGWEDTGPDRVGFPDIELSPDGNAALGDALRAPPGRRRRGPVLWQPSRAMTSALLSATDVFLLFGVPCSAQAQPVSGTRYVVIADLRVLVGQAG